ncbi:MAG: type II secretion system F family protein [Lachnospiraceae bacterium]|nr:type II secretion system F family protein [Lachnospiraceae bacterium]
MATYEYMAVDKGGKQKKGTMDAQTPERVKEFLKNEGLIPISVKEQSFLNKDISIGAKKVKPRDMSVFCKQFASIMQAGVTIINALQMLSEQTENKTLREAVKSVQIDVEKGESLAGAMRNQKEVFPPILIHMVEAGEASGSLDIAFERLSVQFEKQAKINGLVKRSLAYPVVIVLVAIAVVIVMLVVVFPQFEEMFASLDSELPAITKLVQSMSNFVQSFWWLLAMIVAAIVLGIRTYGKTENGQILFSKIALNAPMFGNLTIKSSSATLTRTLSTLLAAGISLVDAVEIVSKVISNAIVRSALENSVEEIQRGVPLSVPLEQSEIFPPMVYHMTRIGEETGNVEEMLSKIADYYEEEVENATAALTSMLEPMIIILLGGLVMFILLSIYLPILSMYSAVENG